MTLDSIVRITASLEPTPSGGATFGRSLFFYPGDTSGTTREAIAGDRARDLRVNTYENLSAVAEDYATTHAAYLAAQAYFGQTPPPQDLLTAGWHAAGAVSYILGATGFAGTAPLTAIKTLGNTTIVAAGQSVAVDLAVSATGTAGYQEVATVIQAALRTITSPDLSGVTVTYDATDEAYEVSIPIGIEIGGVLGGPGADGVGLSAEDGRYYPGVPVETIDEALDRIEMTDGTWHFILMDAATVASDGVLVVGQWVKDNPHRELSISVTGANVLVTNESASRAAQLHALETERISLLWSGLSDYKGASVAGLFAGTDFTQEDSLPTLFAKTLPGRVPDMLTKAQRDELDRKRINYYTTVGGEAIVRPGHTTLAPWWSDTRYWLDWMIQLIQSNVFDLLRNTRRIPLTPRGLGRIRAVVEDVCALGVKNGGIAAGRVSAETTADIRRVTGADFDGFLGRGFLVHIGSVDDQSATDRAARKTPPISVWLKDAGAIHLPDIALLFTQ